MSVGNNRNTVFQYHPTLLATCVGASALSHTMLFIVHVTVHNGQSSDIKHLTDETKFNLINFLYIINRNSDRKASVWTILTHEHCVRVTTC